MGLLKNGRVNMVITNRVLRFSYHKHATLDSLVEKGELELPPETIKDGAIVNKPVLVKLVSDLVREKRWRRKKIYFCLPDDSVVIRQLQIPATLTKEEASSYLRNQVGNSLFLPFDNPSLSIEFLEVNNQQREVLLFAYPKDKIIAFEEVFREAGLRPTVADLTSLSVYRYYYQTQTVESAHVLHIQWNWDVLLLTAFHNHKAVFTRYLKLSTNVELKEMNEDEVDRIISEYHIEINRIIDFYNYSITKGQGNIGLILLSGDYPYLSKVRKTLSDSISVTVDFISEEEELKYTDVLGLALKQEV